MNAADLFQHLENNAGVIQAFIQGTPREQAGWRPTPESWSILEVMVHLLDEEREDFRVRLDHTLHKPDVDWPPINPVGWVRQRNYADRDLEESLQAFLGERVKSLVWLRGLSAPSWESQHVHPKFGTINAGTLLASWVAHDYLHLRQLSKLRFEHVQKLAGSYSVRYAGNW